MASFSVQELVRATEGALVSGDLGVPVAGVSTARRTPSRVEVHSVARTPVPAPRP